MGSARPRGLWAAVAALAASVLASVLSVPAVAISPVDTSPAAVEMLATAARGYWLAASDGGIFSFGDARFFGSTGNIRLNRPIVGMAGSPSGQGYWLAASDGGIFSFGDARFFGSAGSLRLNRPIVSMAATPSGQGYWLAASDGGIFSFGDARFLGSTGNIVLNRPIVAMAPTPTGKGYWLAASDGGIFSFGDAAFLGSGARTNETFVAMTATPMGKGYWLVSREGRTFAFGDAGPFGSAEHVTQPIVGIARTPTGSGGWLMASDGGIFSFGDARFLGSTGGTRLNRPIVAGAAVLGAAPSPQSPPAPAPSPSQPPAPTPVAPSSPSGGAFRIGLIGDTGYSGADDAKLVSQRGRMNKASLTFVVHDGDIQMQNTPCTDQRLKYVRDVFDGFAAPFVFTPGDNEYKNCPDSKARLQAIRRIFFPDNQTLGKTRMTVERQATYVENARWSRGGVTFATMNVPGGGGGIPSSANIAWLNQTFDAAEAAHAAGVMIVWQADDAFSGSDLGGITDALEKRAAAFGRPVVLVHGDGHSYTLDHPWSNIPNLTRLETYYGASGKWVQATVDAATPQVFTFETMR